MIPHTRVSNSSIAQYQFSFVGLVGRAYFDAIGTNENRSSSWNASMEHIVTDDI